jgi:uncharacterized repeat protein (TIGR03803 family)
MKFNRYLVAGFAARLLAFLFTCPPAGAQSTYALKTIHTFLGAPSDGTNPGNLLASGGSIYGTTSFGGAEKDGTVYSLTPPTSQGGPWTEKTLYNFPGGGKGSTPSLALAADSNGVLYGIARSGNEGNLAYSLTPPTAEGGEWTYSTLCVFEGGVEGTYPSPQLTVWNGVVYGTMGSGGPTDEGVVFMLTPPGTGGAPWTENVIYNAGTNAGGLVPGPGALYGIGAAGVFSLVPPASQGGVWTEDVLYTFAGGNEVNPILGGLTLGANGVLYGATEDGGAFGVGSVFSLTPPESGEGTWTEATIYDFPGGGGGAYPVTTLALAGGILYGTAEGPASGIVFSLTPPKTQGGAWTYALLHDITETSGDEDPVYGVIASKQGVVYGTTPMQLGLSAGTVFALVP